MIQNRDATTRFLICVGTILAQASALLGTDGIISHRLRQTVRRLCRMASFMLRRVIVMEALARIAAGEAPPPSVQLRRGCHLSLIPADPPPSQGDDAGDICASEVDTKGRDQEPSAIIPPWSMPLIETALDLRPRKPSRLNRRPDTLDPHFPLDPAEAYRLHLRIEAILRASKSRAAQVERLMAWFARSREEDTLCIPWRYGARLAERHREFGQFMREVVEAATAALDAYIAQLHDPPQAADASDSDKDVQALPDLASSQVRGRERAPNLFLNSQAL